MNKKEVKEKFLKKCGGPVFSWSPLPVKKKLDFSNNTQLMEDESSKKSELYPNCEFQVWLRSCEKEVLNPLLGKVTGKIPDWLNGTLLRNGPGTLKAGQDEFQHLFDCSALIHKFAIENGIVTYQCRFLQSEIYKKIWKANRLVMTEFGTKAVPDPCQTIFQKISTIFNLKSNLSDNAMVSVYPYGDEIYALGEMPFIHKINLENLETLQRVDISENLNIVHHTSHPHIMNDMSVYNIGMSIYPSGPYYSVIHFPAINKRINGENNSSMFNNARIVASIPARWKLNPAYMHSFGITGNYFIIIEQPLSICLPNLIRLKFQNEPLAGAFSWYEEEYTQINVISRETGKLAFKFFAEAFFFLHIINQYEENDFLILDVCAYRDPSMLECMYIETMKNMQSNPNYAKMFRGRPIRFVLPLNPISQENALADNNLINFEMTTKAAAYYLPTGDIFVKPEILSNLGCETPRINYEKYSGKSYRYFYAISADVDAENPGTIIKIDTHTKTCKTWQAEKCFPSEPIFVASPESHLEDDGVILSVLIWGGEDKNHVGILILDAAKFTELGRAEFHTPCEVPKCLHGWFVPKKN